MKPRVFVLACLIASAHSQQQKAPEFEVASIKPLKGPPDRMFFGLKPGGTFSASAMNVKFLIEEAYDVKDSQLIDAPSWTNTDRFDIEAKCDEATAHALDKLPPDQRRDQVRLMIQGLLTDRFKLVLDHDSKELPVYALTVAKNGPKLTPSTFKPPDHPEDGPPPKFGPGPGIMMNGRGQLHATYGDMEMLANVLSRMSGRPVVNKTGLTGKYDWDLKWTPDESMAQPMGGPPPGTGDAPPPDASGPSLFTAVQEQLGLKLEPQKSMMDVLIVKHIERPSEN